MQIRFTWIVIFILLGLFTYPLFSQNIDFKTDDKNHPSFKLSKTDSIALVKLPELTLKSHNKLELPDMVDNSGQPYFRPLFEQSSVECNQYSGIAFTFTYEMNYARNTPANIPENQYPTHYTFNYMNGGYGWQGVSYFYSWDVVKTNGHPNVADYGGMNVDVKRWISGYDKYYNGMFNKLDEVYQIHTSDEEGLLTLKHWLDNHLTGDDVGGIASFFSPSPWNATTLPPGTPEGGKHVIAGFSGHAGHANTIVGYNDSIRYDYNGDGLYTNDIDINGDGLINMKDREIGGLKFTDSYIDGINWADSGFCYMMYNTLAREVSEGGIWNQAVHVLKVKEDYSPQLTLKVKLNYNCREKIKVMAGVSDNADDIDPDHIMNFPIFNYQAGCQYMQGGTDLIENKILEFGLDITPLLSYVSSGTDSKFFLIIDENDPLGWGSGEIVEFSIIDYTQGSTTTEYPLQNIPIVQNGLTKIAVNTTIEFDSPEILTESLPLAYTHEPYEMQLQAEGGKEPFSWAIKKHIDKSVTSIDYPQINGSQLVFDDTIRSIAFQEIDFNFPFYGETYDSIYIHTDGFLMFDDQEYPWGYMHDEELMLRSTKNISPYLNSWIHIDTSTDDGVWYDGNENYAAFYWKMSSEKLSLTNISFAVFFYPDGKMEFYYGPEEIFIQGYFASGISNGDGLNYTYLHTDEYYPVAPNKKILLTPVNFPIELSVDDNGFLSGTPDQNYEGLNIDIVLTDDYNIAQTKTFAFYSYVAAVDEKKQEPLSVKSFPNPINSELNLEFTLIESSPISLHLFNVNGQEFILQPAKEIPKGTHKLKFDISSIPQIKNGIYYVVGKCEDKFIFTSKIIYLGD